MTAHRLPWRTITQAETLGRVGLMKRSLRQWLLRQRPLDFDFWDMS